MHFVREHLLEGNLWKRPRLLGWKRELPKTSRTTKIWTDEKQSPTRSETIPCQGRRALICFCKMLQKKMDNSISFEPLSFLEFFGRFMDFQQIRSSGTCRDSDRTLSKSLRKISDLGNIQQHSANIRNSTDSWSRAEACKYCRS